MLQYISRSTRIYAIFLYILVSIHNHCVWWPGGSQVSMRMYFRVFKSFASFTTCIMIYLPLNDAFGEKLVDDILRLLDLLTDDITKKPAIVVLRSLAEENEAFSCWNGKCCYLYTISQLPLSGRHYWLTMLKSGWMCQCGSQGVHSIVTYPVIIWNVFIFHILSPNEFTCFFVKIISQEQFCFLTPKNSLAWGPLWAPFPAPFLGRRINVPSKQRLLEIWLLWDLNSESSAGCWLGRGNLS